MRALSVVCCLWQEMLGMFSMTPLNYTCKNTTNEKNITLLCFNFM